MKRGLLILLLISGNSLLYLGCDDCGDQPSPDYYFTPIDLSAEHDNPENKDTLTFADYGLSITPETETRYSARIPMPNSFKLASTVYACDPYVGRFYGYDPAIQQIAVITDFDFNDTYSAGDTISQIVYRELYGNRQFLTDVNTLEIPENFFDEPFKISENPEDSVAQRFTVVLRLSNGIDLTATTGELYIQ